MEKLQQAAAVAAASENCTCLVLDLRRISTINASGAVGLARLRDSLAKQGSQLLLAGATHNNRHGQALHARGVLAHSAGTNASPPAVQAAGSARQLFADVDLTTKSAPQTSPTNQPLKPAQQTSPSNKRHRQRRQRR